MLYNVALNVNVNKNTPLFPAFLDASKAIDRKKTTTIYLQIHAGLRGFRQC